MPHEVIFVFIRYFTGAIMSEKSCQKRGVWKKYVKGVWPYRGVVYKRGVQTFRTLCVKPVVKKDSANDKRNHGTVSILSNISKIYERLLYKQLETYLEPILSQYQVGFRKGFRVLTTLLAMIKKRRESLD